MLNIDSARPTGLVNGMMVIDRFSSTLGGCPTRLVYISKRCKVRKVVGAYMAKVVDGNFGKYPTGLKRTDVLTRPLTLLTGFS